MGRWQRTCPPSTPNPRRAAVAEECLGRVRGSVACRSESVYPSGSLRRFRLVLPEFATWRPVPTSTSMGCTRCARRPGAPTCTTAGAGAPRRSWSLARYAPGAADSALSGLSRPHLLWIRTSPTNWLRPLLGWGSVTRSSRSSTGMTCRTGAPATIATASSRSASAVPRSAWSCCAPISTATSMHWRHSSTTCP